jgi:TIGR00252 family protein
MMKDKQNTCGVHGKNAEDLAVEFLQRQGIKVIARNVRSRYGEIDIIAQENDTLLFVEVRLRQSASFGGAAASITAAKQKRLHTAASLYLSERADQPPCRFDAILLSALEVNQIVWLRDIF